MGPTTIPLHVALLPPAYTSETSPRHLLGCRLQQQDSPSKAPLCASVSGGGVGVSSKILEAEKPPDTATLPPKVPLLKQRPQLLEDKGALSRRVSERRTRKESSCVIFCRKTRL